jgi:hypothetical protein
VLVRGSLETRERCTHEGTNQLARRPRAFAAERLLTDREVDFRASPPEFGEVAPGPVTQGQVDDCPDQLRFIGPQRRRAIQSDVPLVGDSHAPLQTNSVTEGAMSHRPNDTSDLRAMPSDYAPTTAMRSKAFLYVWK